MVWAPGSSAGPGHQPVLGSGRVRGRRVDGYCDAVDETRARQRLDQEVERVGKLISEVREGLGEGSESEELSELSHNDQHAADVGTETFEREKDLAILESLERELRDLQASVERIDEGTYGTCEACGGQIAAERLEVHPTARFCVDHEPERH